MSDSESLIVSSAGPRRIRIVVVVLSILFLFLVGVLALSFAVHAGERRFGYQSYTRSAVASDNVVCSQHGQELLDEGGNAVDAAIGVLLCLGVTHPHSSGLGGGAIFLIRTPTGLFDTVDARETAGAAAHVHMFKNTSSEKGGLSVAVPGELSGMLEVHRRHGRLAWNRLFEQSVALCEQGFAVDSSLAAAILDTLTFADKDTRLGKLLFGKKEGDIVTRADLAATLRTLAERPLEFVNGSLARRAAEEIQQQGGVLTAKDFASYVPRSVELVSTFLRGRRVVSVGAEFGGSVLVQAVNTLEGLLDAQARPGTVLFLHYVAEALKFAFANRMLLGDPAFEPQVVAIIAKMIDPEHAASLRARISPTHTFPVDHYADLGNVSAPSQSAGTTHVR